MEFCDDEAMDGWVDGWNSRVEERAPFFGADISSHRRLTQKEDLSDRSSYSGDRHRRHAPLAKRVRGEVPGGPDRTGPHGTGNLLQIPPDC